MNKALRTIIMAAIKVGTAALLCSIVFLACAFVSWELDWGRWPWPLRLVFVMYGLGAILWPFTEIEKSKRGEKQNGN